MTGSGLIETIRVRGGTAPLWRLHLERLTTASAALGLALPERIVAPSGGADRVVRLLLDRDGISASQRSAEVPLPLRLVVVRQPHVSYPFKTTARGVFDRASRQAEEAGADEPVLLASRRLVAETARWGLYWWEGDQLCAPSRALGVLPSVARARIEELVPVAERMVEPEQLGECPRFVANAARGIVEVTAWNGDALPLSGQTRALAAQFWP